MWCEVSLLQPRLALGVDTKGVHSALLICRLLSTGQKTVAICSDSDAIIVFLISFRWRKCLLLVF